MCVLGEVKTRANPYHNQNGCSREAYAAGRRKILTLNDRVDVLKRIDNGESCRSIAAAVNCRKSQISRIRSDRAAILKEWESGTRYDLKYVKRRKGTYKELNTLVWEWFNKARSKELPVSGRLLQVCNLGNVV